IASLLAIGTGIGTKPMPAVKLLLGEGSFEFGEDFEQITYQADIGDFKDGRVGILVDRNDGARILDAGEMLDGPRNTDGDVELRRDDLAGLADLEVIGHVTGIDGGARGADGGAEFVGERVDDLEILLAANAASAGDDTRRRLQIRAL